ncbi:hypothetical protein LXA43DRAFT_334892 [Ganoderma leucocontextum]|nr:hypothetical protein LXA43DRAFT_334892 [Ganoderma leucocontextum]
MVLSCGPQLPLFQRNPKDNNKVDRFCMPDFTLWILGDQAADTIMLTVEIKPLRNAVWDSETGRERGAAAIFAAMPQLLIQAKLALMDHPSQQKIVLLAASGPWWRSLQYTRSELCLPSVFASRSSTTAANSSMDVDLDERSDVLAGDSRTGQVDPIEGPNLVLSDEASFSSQHRDKRRLSDAETEDQEDSRRSDGPSIRKRLRPSTFSGTRPLIPLDGGDSFENWSDEVTTDSSGSEWNDEEETAPEMDDSERLRVDHVFHLTGNPQTHKMQLGPWFRAFLHMLIEDPRRKD